MRLEKLTVLVIALSLVLSAPSTPGYADSEYKFGELTALADKYGTDKGTGSSGHLFTEVYEYFFLPLKYTARKILEIGIAEGASLKMFQDYFPNAGYYGIDIEDSSRLNSDTVKTFVADQSDRKQLKKFIDVHGFNFDIILDDGGHTMEQQQVSFGYLFRYLKPGGYYIIEDVHTSIPEFLPGYGKDKNEANTTLVMINNFIRNGKIKSRYMTAEEKKYLTGNIAYCNLFSRNKGRSITCIFKKM